MLVSDIQAVVFAGGRGSRITHMIGTTVPKCLLRICGQPLIYYPLKTLANYGFQDVSVIIQEREDVELVVKQLGTLLGLRIDFLTIQEDDEEFGTLESLRNFLKANKINKLKKDILLMSCDTITDVKLNSLVNFHKGHSASCSALFAKPYAPTLPAGSKLPGPKVKGPKERDIVGIRPDNSQLIFMASEADMDEELAIPYDVLRASPHTKLHTNLVDAHIYIFRREVLERTAQDKATTELLSLKGEFLPYIVHEQLKNFDPTYVPDILVKPDEKVTVFAVRQLESHVLRVNTVAAFSSACKSGEWLRQNFPDTGGKAGGVQIAKSAKLGGSLLGENCIVGEKAKVVNVIAMENVTFEDGCQVENSIISANAIIGSKAIVKECLVAPGYQVPEGGRFVNETLNVMEDTLFED